MSKRYTDIATPANLEKVRGWGFMPTPSANVSGCTQCGSCDRWTHDSRLWWSGGGGEEPEYEAHCLKCALEQIEMNEGYVDWCEMHIRLPLAVLSLERVKSRPRLVQYLSRRWVRIWSHEWHTWWREEGAGYTDTVPCSGIYSGDDAFARTWHCCPKKQIRFEIIGIKS